MSAEVLLEAVPVPGDGDCFFYSLLVDVGYLNERTLWQESTARNPSALAKNAAAKLRALFLRALERPDIATRFSEDERADMKRRLRGRQYVQTEELQLAALLFELRFHLLMWFGKDEAQAPTWIRVGPAGQEAREAAPSHCSDADVVMELHGLHYTPLRWAEQACVKRLLVRFMRNIRGFSRKRAESASADSERAEGASSFAAPTPSEACQEVLASLSRTYRSVKNCHRKGAAQDTVSAFRTLRHASLRELRSLLAPEGASTLGFREALRELCGRRQAAGPSAPDPARVSKLFRQLRDLLDELYSAAERSCGRANAPPLKSPRA